MPATRIRSSVFAALLALGLIGASGCRQGIGGRCQVSSDCDKGLYCVLPIGGTPASGGRCETAAGPDMSVDMGPDLALENLDLSSEGPDLEPQPDFAAPRDLSPVD